MRSATPALDVAIAAMVCTVVVVLVVPAGAASAAAAPNQVPRTNGTVFTWTGGKPADWESWKWSSIMAVGFWSDLPAGAIAKAKSMGVPLAQVYDMPPTTQWPNASARADYVSQVVSKLQAKGYTGTSFDYEGNGLSDDEKNGYTALVKDMATALKAAFGEMAFLSICVGGTPEYEFRNYHYADMAQALEDALGPDNPSHLFIMGYDMHMYDDYNCLWQGNCSLAEAPYPIIEKGVSEYRGTAGVPGNRIVLGLPWYGNRWMRVAGIPINMGQIAYKDVLGVLDNHTDWKPTWDDRFKAWQLKCNNQQCTPKGKGSEIWYEDATSLAPKLALAKTYGLRGVGMWEATDLPYETHPDKANAVWQAFAGWQGQR